MERVDIKSLKLEAITEELKEMEEPSFRGRQVYEWLHKKGAVSFQEMTSLSKELREKLDERYEIRPLIRIDRLTSEKDGTSKFLFRLMDGRVIESVWMKYHHGNSVCISSQAGCRMGCHFCASTIGGLERNLTASEMLSQIYEIQKITGERVSHVVVMGTGEPLDNYDNLLRFLSMLTDENGLHISQRNLTVSTCGLVPQIYSLAKEKLQMTLAISLHAPTDFVRRELMPIANSYSIAEILQACRFYIEETGRRITFEYSLVQGINDSADKAEQLAVLLRGINCHVNLIPVNPIKERDFKHSDAGLIQKFKLILEKNRINVTIRREMGSDIEAACGQLRKSYIEKIEEKRRGNS